MGVKVILALDESASIAVQSAVLTSETVYTGAESMETMTVLWIQVCHSLIPVAEEHGMQSSTITCKDTVSLHSIKLRSSLSHFLMMTSSISLMNGESEEKRSN